MCVVDGAHASRHAALLSLAFHPTTPLLWHCRQQQCNLLPNASHACRLQHTPGPACRGCRAPLCHCGWLLGQVDKCKHTLHACTHGIREWLSEARWEEASSSSLTGENNVQRRETQVMQSLARQVKWEANSNQLSCHAIETYLSWCSPLLLSAAQTCSTASPSKRGQLRIPSSGIAFS